MGDGVSFLVAFLVSELGVVDSLGIRKGRRAGRGVEEWGGGEAGVRTSNRPRDSSSLSTRLWRDWMRASSRAVVIAIEPGFGAEVVGVILLKTRSCSVSAYSEMID